MRKKTLITFAAFFVLIVLNLYITFKVIAKEQRAAEMNRVLAEIEEIGESYQAFDTSDEAPTGDRRVANLKAFFREYGSPLYDHAEILVKEADDKKYDYRLLAAIAMKESTLCKFIPKNSHNCWGWGIYDNTVTRFSSYEEAIKTVSIGIKKGYIDVGLDTPEKIMAKYTGHPENTSWAKTVNSVFKYFE